MTNITGAQTPPDGAADAGAANAGGAGEKADQAGNQNEPPEMGGSPDPNEMIPRSELLKVVRQRDEMKGQMRSVAGRLEQLEQMFGGTLPSGDEVEKLRSAREEAEAARKAKMVAEGKIDELVSEARADMQAALKEQSKKTEGLMGQLKEERAGRLASGLLVKADVMGAAAAQAAAAMLNPAEDNIRIDLKENPQSGALEPVLVDRNMNGSWPLNSEGGNMTFDQFAARFKAQHPYYFKSTMPPGTGGTGPDGQQVPSDQSSVEALRKRWEQDGDMDAYKAWEAAVEAQTAKR